MQPPSRPVARTSVPCRSRQHGSCGSHVCTRTCRRLHECRKQRHALHTQRPSASSSIIGALAPRPRRFRPTKRAQRRDLVLDLSDEADPEGSAPLRQIIRIRSYPPKPKLERTQSPESTYCSDGAPSFHIQTGHPRHSQHCTRRMIMAYVTRPGAPEFTSRLLGALSLWLELGECRGG